MHELVWPFDQELSPSWCLCDGVWPAAVITNDFGHVVHENQTTDLVAVEDVEYFDLQTSFLGIISVCIVFSYSVRVRRVLYFEAAY